MIILCMLFNKKKKGKFSLGIQSRDEDEQAGGQSARKDRTQEVGDGCKRS